MPDPEHHKHTDEELLANAIPIEGLEEQDEDEDDLLVLDEQQQEEFEAIDLAESDGGEDASGESKIRQFGRTNRAETKWNRQPNLTGQGATHVKTFVAKLRLDAMENLDEQVNAWLDQHPEVEVKFVTTTVGDLKGKITEQALFMNLWV